MASRHAFACALWAFLMVHGDATAAGAGWRRDRTCLTGVAPYAAGQRRNITVNGFAGPLKLGAGDWMAPNIIGWMAKVLIEEVFGVNVELRLWPSSRVMIQAISSCKDPINMTHGQCDVPGPALADLVICVWKTANGDNILEWLKNTLPAQYPIDLGSLGYSGYVIFIVKESSTQPAMQQHYLPLEYYKSYSHPQIEVSSYFDSMFNISDSDLMPCARTQMDDAVDAANYVAFTGDTAGVTAEGDKLACTNNYWWIAPACRADMTKCIPFITGGDGWDIRYAAQRAAKWGMPLAVATAKDWGTFVALPKTFRTMAGWWVPDETFLDVNPVTVTFPKHDPAMQAEGKLFNDFPEQPVTKMAFSGMANRSNEGGTARILRLMRNLQISQQEILSLLRLRETKPAGTDGIEETACEWLNANPVRWKAWIGVETNCVEGQGLVGTEGDFVHNRTTAKSCSWCTPGRVSVGLTDADGNTYRCEECYEGTFQVDVGMTQCSPCAAGTAAPRKGMATCARCGIGEFVDSEGAVRCESCPRGFVTSFEGAQSVDACICPAGKYRDGTHRDLCLDCAAGMVCETGSDALGFLPEQAAQYPIVPTLKPGFWSSAEEPLSVFRCENEIRCPGGRAPGDACFDKLEAQACQHCMQGYVWNGATCMACSSYDSAYVVVPFIPLIMLPFVVIGVYKFFSDEYSQWGKWTNSVGAMLFLLLHHYHLMQVIYRTDTAFPKPVASTLSTFSWTRDVWSLFQIGCYGFTSFSRRMVLQSLGPMFLIVAYILVWSASQLIGMRAPSVKMEINRTINGLLSLILTFFTGIVDMALTIFKCAHNPNGLYTLVSDRSIVCDEGEWKAMLAVGVASVLIWCVGSMLIFVYAIWSAPKNFHRRDVQMRWKFLFIRYRADVHWWALAIMAKSILVNIGCIVLALGIGQMTWIFLTLLVYTHVAIVWRPWRAVLNNFVDIDVHFSLALACFAMAWFASQDLDVGSLAAGNDLGDVLVKVSNFAPPAFCVPVAIAMYWRSKSGSARSQKEKDITVLSNAIQLLGREDTDLHTFLHSLSEADWLAMVRAKDIVQTELAARRARLGYSANELSQLRMTVISNENAGETRKASSAKEPDDSDEFFAIGHERSHTPALRQQGPRWGVSAAPRTPRAPPMV